MKLNLPKIIRPIALADYAPELALHDDGSAAVVQVWINPPAPLLARHTELRERGKAANARLTGDTLSGDDLKAVAAELSDVGRGLATLYAELWGQHADATTHWTVEDVLQLSANDANPDLFGWLTNRTISLINDYRSGLRKN